MRHWRNALLIGFAVGVVFGLLNLGFAWLLPLEDDTPLVLLRFYGPMFFCWAFLAYRTAQRSGSLFHAIATALVVSFGTFCVYSVFNAVRVNLFLDELTGRPDWQDMMARFHASGGNSLRRFVNLDYLKGTPGKLTATELIGAIMGVCGGVVGCAAKPPQPERRTGVVA